LPYPDLLPLIYGQLVQVEGGQVLLLFFTAATEGTYHLNVQSLHLLNN